MNAPSVAAETVPEYSRSTPTLAPALMPETTTSGRSVTRVDRASLTQSAGVPVTPRPKKPWSRNSFTRRGAESVMAWPTADCSVTGATTATSCPAAHRAACMARRPTA